MKTPRIFPRTAFTLVELLVVIGIIAVLMGILLPVMSKARQGAQTAKCLANLHAIGHSLLTYSIDNHNYNVPSYANSQGYWFNILVNQGYLTAPDSTGKSGAEINKNVFFCPSGSLDVTPYANTAPSSRINNTPDVGFRSPSPPSGTPVSTVDCWYAINGGATGSSGGYSQELGPPFHSMWDVDDSAKKGEYAFVSAGSIRRCAELVAIYDGLIYNMFTFSPAGANADGTGGMGGNECRLSARHNAKTRTNLLFMDGHAAAYITADLPGGITAKPGDNGKDFDLANLRMNYGSPQPQWRLETVRD